MVHHKITTIWLVDSLNV